MSSDKEAAAASEESDQNASREKSILGQIARTQQCLDRHYYRIDVLERALKYKEMTIEEREKMEEELESIKKLLKVNEAALKQLQAENRKTASVAWLIVVLCFAIFCIYNVFTNPY